MMMMMNSSRAVFYQSFCSPRVFHLAWLVYYRPYKTSRIHEPLMRIAAVAALYRLLLRRLSVMHTETRLTDVGYVHRLTMMKRNRPRLYDSAQSTDHSSQQGC